MPFPLGKGQLNTPKNSPQSGKGPILPLPPPSPFGFVIEAS